MAAVGRRWGGAAGNGGGTAVDDKLQFASSAVSYLNLNLNLNSNYFFAKVEFM